MLKEQDIDILCISETMLYPSIKSAFVSIPSYSIYHQDLGRGGGVCLYVKNDLKVTEINIGNEKHEGVEDKWISVQHRKFRSIIIGCVYRYPKAPVTSFDYVLDIFKALM